MEYSGKQHWILGLALVLSLAPTGSRGDEKVFNCSRYEFNKNNNKNINSWAASEKACESKNGTLVAMETLAEWEFINKHIQRKTTPTEWFIGLKNENGWKWINGQTLTIEKWAYPPSISGEKQYSKIIKYYRGEGTFGDVKGKEQFPYICEYPKDSEECTKNARTTSSTFKTITMSSLSSRTVTQSPTAITVKIQTEPKTTQAKSTNKQIQRTTKKKNTSESIRTNIPSSHIAFVSTESIVRETLQSTIHTTFGKPKEHQKSDNKQDDGMMIIYIAVSLAVVLVILICVLGVCYWKRLKKEKRKTSEDKLIDSSMATSPQPTTTANVNEIMKSSSFVAFKMVHNNLSDSTAPSGGPVYDNVCTENNQVVDRGTHLTDTNEGSQGNQNVSVKKKKFSLKRNKGSVSASTSTDENKSSDEVVYAAVDKTKKKMVIQEVTYTDLAPFNNNAEVNVHKPEPYQPVEYAVIIGKKASKSSK